MSTMDWSNELIMEFIQLYESYPVLWDPQHKNHKNRNSLYDAWQNIAKEISTEVSVDALRKKKESLMATYRTLAKKVRSSQTTGSGAKDVYVPTWFAFDAIDRFIRATTKKIPSLCSEESHIEEFLEEDISQNEQHLMNDEDIIEQANSDPLSLETSQNRDSLESGNEMRESTNFALPQGAAPKKKGRASLSQVELNVNKHLKLASDVLTGLAKKSQTKQMETVVHDESALYGQLWAGKLKRLSKRTQLVLQNKIDNIIFEAELEEMDSSNSINTLSVINPNNYLSVSTPPSNSHGSSSPTCVLSPVACEVAEGKVVTYYTTETDILGLTNRNNM